MLQEIAKAVGLEFDENNEAFLSYLRRVERKLPLVVEINHRNVGFKRAVVQAFLDVKAEGPLVKNTAPAVPQPKVLKIKSVPKGERLETVAPNGIRYSFGPKWNDSVISGKGIAISDSNREKLEYQATLLGITGDLKVFTSRQLAVQIAPLL